MRSDDDPRLDDGLDPQVGQWLDAAYAAKVDVETAASHLWRIHREANAAEPLVLPDTLMERAEQIVAGDGQLGLQRDEPAPTPPPARRPRRSLVAVLSAVFMFSTSGIAIAASGGALPGDMLYPVKLGAERAQLILTLSPDRDAQLHLRFAQNRLDEAAAVLEVRPESVPRLLLAAADAADTAERLAGPAVSRDVAEVRQAAGTTLTTIQATADSSSAEELSRLADRLGVGAVALEGDEGSDRETNARTGASEAPTSSTSTADRSADETPPRVVERPVERAVPRPLPADPVPSELEPSSEAEPPSAAERPDPPRSNGGVPSTTSEEGRESTTGGQTGAAPTDEENPPSDGGETPAEQPQDGEGPADDTGDADADESDEDGAAPEEEGRKRRPPMGELAERFEDE
jgi:hypothetical protein